MNGGDYPIRVRNKMVAMTIAAANIQNIDRCRKAKQSRF